MAHAIDLKNLKNIRRVHVSCEHATLDGLSLELDLNQDKLSSSSGNSSSSSPLIAKDHARDGKYHLLIAASGSVATIKLPNIIRRFSHHRNLSIRVILTESAAEFLRGQSEEQPDLDTIAKFPNVDAIYRNEDEWRVPWTRGAPILHIELRRWADLLVIAPLSANTLAKISNGICDNLLTSVVRAWEVLPAPSSNDESSTEDLVSEPENPRQKRIVIAPAMNTAMWRHPLTAAHLRAPGQEEYYHWFDILRPIEKELACGDSGDGAMADWKEIAVIIERKMENQGIVRDQNP